VRGLNDKRIVVAGGANGIGAATAERLAQEGASVLIGDIDEAGMARTVASLRDAGHRVHGHRLDLASDASIAALIEHAVATLGGLDGLAITAADLSKQTLGADADLNAMQRGIWERTLQINLIGHGVLIRSALPHLKAAGGGAIVTTSSATAYAGSVEVPAYAASKYGLHALVRHTATLAGKDGTRCNAIAPGLVLTEGGKVNLTQAAHDAALGAMALPRLGLPEDLAAAYAFLLSDDAAWITGQVISVNGGQCFRD
jgi:NAD(P)-dependent dehydrogenase (short-subunit alcohol dehydrogenase family)